MGASPRQPARHEVWARVAWDVIDLAERSGVDTATLFRGLAFDAQSVRRMRRIAWDDYCTLVERVESSVGGPESLTRISEDGYHRTSPELTAIAAALIGPKPLFRLIYEVVNPLLFPMVEFVYEDRGPRSIHVEAWLRPGVRPCLALHHGVLGAMRGLPRHLGLPPAVVTGETAADHVAWDIELPASRTLASRAARVTKETIARAFGTAIVLGNEQDGTPVSVGLGRTTFDDAETRLQRAADRWRLTPRQIDVLRVLVRGKANKEIAVDLECAENTVELHVTQLLRRAGVVSRAELISRFFSNR
jgi:DNA-binding CsgD family transcriptional regulator